MDKQVVKSQLKPFAKPPPPEPLEEEEYLEGVSEIIKRDFFPELEELKVKNEILDALNQSDPIKAHHLEQELLRENSDKSIPFKLDQFQQKFTSEDNASFSQILDKDNHLRKQKYSFFYEKKLLLDNEKAIEYNPKNALMYGPTEVALTPADLPVTRGDPKELVHSNTRFKEPLRVFHASEEKQQAKQVFDSFRQPTPQVNGYKLVPQTPDLKPHEDVEPNELMTWGSIVSTPLILASDRPEPSYHIPPTPHRELLANKLTEKASQSIRKGQGKTPLRNSPAIQHLQRQLTRTGMDFGLGYQTPKPLSARRTPVFTPRRSTPVVNRKKDITDNLLDL